MATFIGACKRCKGVARIELACESHTHHVGYGRYETAYFYTFPNGRRIEGRGHDVYATCLCGGSAHFRRIIGTRTEQKCGARCLASKGPSCECACGGRNHGASWA